MTVKWEIRPVTYFELVRIEQGDRGEGGSKCSIETFGFYLSQDLAETAREVFKDLKEPEPDKEEASA